MHVPITLCAVNETALAAFEQFRELYSDWQLVEHSVGYMASFADPAEILVAEADGVIVGVAAYVGPEQFPRTDNELLSVFRRSK